MKESQISKSDKEHGGEILYLLNAIAKSSYKGNAEKGKALLNEVKGIVGPGKEYLLDAIQTHFFWASQCKMVLEKHIVDEFFSNIGFYLPGATKVRRKINPKHIPDGFVEYKGVVLPVEVKRDAVVLSTIKQIGRYMKAYSLCGGVVVAPELRVNLPTNVTFIKVEVKR